MRWQADLRPSFVQVLTVFDREDLIASKLEFGAVSLWLPMIRNAESAARLPSRFPGHPHVQDLACPVIGMFHSETLLKHGTPEEPGILPQVLENRGRAGPAAAGMALA